MGEIQTETVLAVDEVSTQVGEIAAAVEQISAETAEHLSGLVGRFTVV